MLGSAYRTHIVASVELIVCDVEADWRGTGDTCVIGRVKSLDPDVLLSRR